MKKLLIVGLLAGGAIYYLGCSRDDREEIVDRVGNAGRALAGESEKVPSVVKEQQRKERTRQDKTWTAENRTKHPIEFCQAKLEEIEKLMQKQAVQVTHYSTMASEMKRKVADSQAQISHLTKFLADGKTAYRKAEAENVWPTTLNGIPLRKEKLQEKIVEAAQRLQSCKQMITGAGAALAKVEKKLQAVMGEQTKLIKLKTRFESSLADLQTKKIVDGEKGITDALNEISDQLDGLVPVQDDIALDDLLAPDKTTTIAAEFEKIMTE